MRIEGVRVVEQYLDKKGIVVLVDEFGNTYHAPTEPVHLWRWRTLTLWIMVFSTAVFFTVRDIRHLGHENKVRITEIQESRVTSCKANYKVLRKVIARAFQVRDRKLTDEQAARLNSLLQLADPKKCQQQVATDKNPAPKKGR